MVCHLTCSFHMSSLQRPMSWQRLSVSIWNTLKTHASPRWPQCVEAILVGHSPDADLRRIVTATEGQCFSISHLGEGHFDAIDCVCFGTVYHCMHCDGFNVPVIESWVVPFKYLVSHTFWKRWEATWSDTCNFAQTFAPLQPCCREVSSSWNLKQWFLWRLAAEELRSHPSYHARHEIMIRFCC